MAQLGRVKAKLQRHRWCMEKKGGTDLRSAVFSETSRVMLPCSGQFGETPGLVDRRVRRKTEGWGGHPDSGELPAADHHLAATQGCSGTTRRSAARRDGVMS